MTDIRKAKEIAKLARLSEDELSESINPHDFRGREYHKDTMLRHGVLISKSVTPSLDDRLNAVCKTLQLPRECVTAFVYNSPEVQADCLIDTPDSCVLRFTSGLVNLMDEHEFKFVVGHELGHFLLSHGTCSQHLSEGSSEDFMMMRARELSADRLGYLSIGKQEESIQAIIKTASGLSNQFLRFDIASYISQIDKISDHSRDESINNTHPSMLIRCRSLLWFAMSIHSIEDLEKVSQEKIKEINSRVAKDLEKFVDGQIKLRKIEFEKDIALWKSALLIYHSGSFTKEVQKRFGDEMGKDTLRSIKSFFELYSKEELLEEISRRLDDSLKKSHNEFPSTAQNIETAGYEIAYRIVES